MLRMTYLSLAKKIRALTRARYNIARGYAILSSRCDASSAGSGSVLGDMVSITGGFVARMLESARYRRTRPRLSSKDSRSRREQS